MKVESQFIGSSYIEEELCDEILEYFYSADYKVNGAVENNGKAVVRESIKDSIDCPLVDEVLKLKYIDSLQKNIINDYVKEYEFCNDNSPWAIIDFPNIQYYRPNNGAYKKWHCERSTGWEQNSASRHLVYMTYLNDVDDGGETEFFYQNLKIKPKKGLTLIWPADWTFTHRGVISPSEEKYIITGWYNYTK
jgi:prolyl 4-hydroxylase